MLTWGRLRGKGVFFGSGKKKSKVHLDTVTEMPVRHLCEGIDRMLELWEENRLYFRGRGM